MTKRATGQFVRREKDHYPTPYSAVLPLLPHLTRMKIKTFAEPCAGEGRKLVEHLERNNLRCVRSGDLTDAVPRNALDWLPEDYAGIDACITNTPWMPTAMAAIMQHHCVFRPSWFLIYADWVFTRQSAHIMTHYCTDIVPIGRVKWIPDSDSVGFDNCCWVCMNANKDHQTIFWPMQKS